MSVPITVYRIHEKCSFSSFFQCYFLLLQLFHPETNVELKFNGKPLSDPSNVAFFDCTGKVIVPRTSSSAFEKEYRVLHRLLKLRLFLITRKLDDKDTCYFLSPERDQFDSTDDEGAKSKQSTKKKATRMKKTCPKKASPKVACHNCILLSFSCVT